jgi:hypothetical protein
MLAAPSSVQSTKQAEAAILLVALNITRCPRQEDFRQDERR